ncbi:hypothetical protein PV328_001145 [Microctonus aethiopoides]|uniref:Uncharacterized protein n=1 Tax=Microctonus aethiopoides TaxID=144406 RepID=A0AA39FWV6_9HYME|nr:hypothetical protein PV328_001145 [Microctonus aethiopoides]
MEIKAKFYFVSEAGADSKSTVVKVKRIQLLGKEESFLFPVGKQTSTQHGQLFENPIVKNVVKSLKVRNKFRNVVLTLTDELQKIYLDIEGNVVLYDEYLEEVTTVQESDVNRKSMVTIFANGCPAIGLYDSGSNVSLVNSKFLSDKRNIKQIIGGRDTIKGLAGMAKTEGVDWT